MPSGLVNLNRKYDLTANKITNIHSLVCFTYEKSKFSNYNSYIQSIDNITIKHHKLHNIL